MNKSFTLIEILIVIVIVGILSSFILVGMSSVTSSASIAKSKAFANSLRNSLLINLVSEYKLEGNSNDSWGTYNGTNNGATSISNCVFQSCLSFDGNNDYVDLGDYDDLPLFWFDNKNWSIFAWIKVNTHNSESCIYALRTGADQDFRIGIDASNKAYITWVSSPAHPAYSRTTSVASLNDQKWHYVGAKRYGDIIVLYIDGLVVGTDSTVGIFDITGNGWFSRWSIGAYREGCCTTWEAGYWAKFFNGLIDEVVVYNASLSQSQTQEDYFLGVNNLFKNNGMDSIEYNQRLSQLKNNLINN